MGSPLRAPIRDHLHSRPNADHFSASILRPTTDADNAVPAGEMPIDTVFPHVQCMRLYVDSLSNHNLQLRTSLNPQRR